MLKYQKLAAEELMQRLNKPNLGASMLPLPWSPDVEAAIKLLNAQGIHTVSQVYLDTWVKPLVSKLQPKPKKSDE